MEQQYVDEAILLAETVAAVEEMKDQDKAYKVCRHNVPLLYYTTVEPHTVNGRLHELDSQLVCYNISPQVQATNLLPFNYVHRNLTVNYIGHLCITAIFVCPKGDLYTQVPLY